MVFFLVELWLVIKIFKVKRRKFYINIQYLRPNLNLNRFQYKNNQLCLLTQFLVKVLARSTVIQHHRVVVWFQLSADLTKKNKKHFSIIQFLKLIVLQQNLFCPIVSFLHLSMPHFLWDNKLSVRNLCPISMRQIAKKYPVHSFIVCSQFIQ